MQRVAGFQKFCLTDGGVELGFGSNNDEGGVEIFHQLERYHGVVTTIKG